MKKIILALVAVFAISAVASASNYFVNEEAIDAAIEAAVEISPINLEVPAALPSATTVSSEQSDVVAVALTFFLGGFGVHRHYMGTKKWMWAIYTFTFGGIFGVVPLVDFIIEIIGLADGSGFKQFYNNPKFIVWL